jgi:hypothetical protein
MAQIRAAGLNMIRTGLWTAWKPELAANGQMSEDALRTIEAFLMCARHNGLPVQFNLFAFYPDEFGGVNGYLDPAALHAESLYAESLVARFHDLPFLAWDLINEPSANKNLWRTLPDLRSVRQAAWRKWIAARYPDQAKLLHDWAEPSLGIGRDLQAQPTATAPEVGGQDPMALPKRRGVPAGCGAERVQSAEGLRLHAVHAVCVLGLGKADAGSDSLDRVTTADHRGAG